MHKQVLLLAAAAGLQVAYADFFLVTESIPTLPKPTNLGTEEEALSYLSNLANAASSIATRHQTLLAQDPSINSQIAAFAATATSWSIPAAITDPSKLTTLTSVPAWFTALPQEVQEYKKAEAAAGLAMASDLIDVVTGGSTLSTATVTVLGTGTGTGNTGSGTVGANETTLRTDPSPSPSTTGREMSPGPSGAAGRRVVGVGAGVLAVVGAGFAFL